ncbi:DsbA family protein [Psychrobium sp. nBUS_13]|uniref:DsbA family protein n=1 Tax=Psychrobium sp. nBUS_13 TaxID=3395319 RepID=UPI003EBA5CDF
MKNATGTVIINALSGVQKNTIKSEKELIEIFSSIGVSKDEFRKGIESEKVNETVNEWKFQIRKNKIKGTPTLIINNKYKIKEVSNSK